MWPFLPFVNVNRNGIPLIASTGITVSTTDVAISLPDHSFRNKWNRGLFLLDLKSAVPAGTTTTLPVVLETNGQKVALTLRGGAPVTVADLPATGVSLVYYDKSTNTLQLGV